MLRLRNNIFNFILLCAIIVSSCGFADLRPVGIKIEPEKTGALLPDYYSPVKLKFDTEMEKRDAEGIMQIISDSGIVRGDLSWEGNNLVFIPIGGWTPGIRYTLSLSGSIRSVDGRDLRLDRYISFYAVSNNEPPVLKWHSPADGESTGTNGVFLELHFSSPMDRLSAESALTIEGVSNKIFEWSGDDTELKVFFDNALSPWSLYRWSLKDSAKNREGIPLAKTYSGQFTTDIDQTLPKIEKIFPVSYYNGQWYPAGYDLSAGLRYGHGIAAEFNKTMGDNILRSLRIEPSLSGKTEMLTQKSIVYSFSSNPEPETIYTLIVSGDTKDTEGLKLGNDYRINFFSDVPVLEINSISFSSAVSENYYVIDNFSAVSNIVSIQVNNETGLLNLSIVFSHSFNEEEKRNSALRISLSPIFPSTLRPIALNNVRWISDNILQMSWEGLKNDNYNVNNYYKLTIPGGKSGIKAEEGIFLSKDAIVYLEVK